MTKTATAEKPIEGRPSQPVMQVQQRAAQIMPATFNDSDNTVDVVWTTGSRRRAYDWYNDTSSRKSSPSTPDAVDMSRFDAGTVQVLDGHRAYGGVGAILGIATRGSIETGKAAPRCAQPANPDLAGVVGDIKAGIIRAISFGYSVQRYEITRAQDRTDGVNLPLYRAVAGRRRKSASCPCPRTPNAGTRSAIHLQGTACRANSSGPPAQHPRKPP
jgi:hypothetical protein